MAICGESRDGDHRLSCGVLVKSMYVCKSEKGAVVRKPSDFEERSHVYRWVLLRGLASYTALIQGRLSSSDGLYVVLRCYRRECGVTRIEQARRACLGYNSKRRKMRKAGLGTPRGELRQYLPMGGLLVQIRLILCMPILPIKRTTHPAIVN